MSEREFLSQTFPSFDAAMNAVVDFAEQARVNGTPTLSKCAATINCGAGETAVTIATRRFIRKRVRGREVKAALLRNDPPNDLRLIVQRPGEAGTILLSKAIAVQAE